MLGRRADRTDEPSAGMGGPAHRRTIVVSGGPGTPNTLLVFGTDGTVGVYLAPADPREWVDRAR